MTPLESAKADLDAYLAANPKADAGVIRALTGAIERVAAAAAKPADGFDMSHTKPSAEPTVSTQKFVSDQAADDWHRLQQTAADEILAKPAFDRDEHDAERAKAIRTVQLGGDGQSYITGMKP
jgi:hypothetical protein